MRENKPSTTAQLVALLRDLLTDPRAGVVDDPWARQLLRPEMRALSATARGPWFRPFLALSDRLSAGIIGTVGARTCFFDEKIQEALRAGIRQVVLLGAGYDARAHRLSVPGARFFEVDHPATQRDKRARLGAASSPGEIVYVPVDFTRDKLAERLRASGHDASQPSFFLWEGVVMYLTEAPIRETLRAIHEQSAPGSQLAFDFTGRSMGVLDELWTRAGSFSFGLVGEPVRFRRDPPAWSELLRTEGWNLRELLDTQEQHARYLRGTVLSVPRPINFLAHAERIELPQGG